MDNLTIWDCAAMANDVYKNEGNPAWKRIMQKSAGDNGFFGAAYKQGDNVVIGVRGTQEAQDVLDDLFMAPNIPGDRAGAALKKLVDDYVKGHSFAKGGGDSLGFLANWIFSRVGVQHATKKWGNQIPPTQAMIARSFSMQVYNYCKANKLRLRCFVGHSLGGALAQYLSEQTGVGGALDIQEGIPAVAFNSPNMGKIQGMSKNAGGGILIVNARLDPLSFLTREVGNESHAASPKHEWRNIDIGTFEPPPRYMPNEQHTTEEYQKFRNWLLRAMKFYHSIDNMQDYLSKEEPGHLTVSYFFPYAYRAFGA